MKQLTFMRFIGEIDSVIKHVEKIHAKNPQELEGLRDFVNEFEAKLDVKIEEVVEKLNQQR